MAATRRNRSFLIADILSLDAQSDSDKRDSTGANEKVGNVVDEKVTKSRAVRALQRLRANQKLDQEAKDSALDALIQMTSAKIQKLDHDLRDNHNYFEPALLAFYSKHAPFKKRRKTRTAFTHQQIVELEKRFINQKYLTPSDRDQIASQLGLTNAQVITWFQNRRAKMKREAEERKNDILAAKRSKVIEVDGEDKDDLPSLDEYASDGNSGEIENSLDEEIDCEETDAQAPTLNISEDDTVPITDKQLTNTETESHNGDKDSNSSH